MTTEAEETLSSFEGDEEQDVVLLSMVQGYHWTAALQRIRDHPEECRASSFRGRTPLHVACAAPFVPVEVVQALIRSYPEACVTVGTSGMNPLHIACSSDHASAEVVQALIVESAAINYRSLTEKMCSMEDVDRDTPLHSACRCGAPFQVLRLLMFVHPQAVHRRDYEGLTPLQRLWVREYVLLGEDVISGVNGPDSLVGELGVAWEKTMLLLYCAYVGSLRALEGNKNKNDNEEHDGSMTPTKTFRPMHAVAGIDCPRRVVKIASKLYRDHLLVRDENGDTPLLIACKAPCYKFRDISDDGPDLEERLEDHLYEDAENDGDDNNGGGSERMSYAVEDPDASLPSVIDLLVAAEPSAAAVPDPSGKSPLQHAVESGKGPSEGVDALKKAAAARAGAPAVAVGDDDLAGLMRGMEGTFKLAAAAPSTHEAAAAAAAAAASSTTVG